MINYYLNKYHYHIDYVVAFDPGGEIIKIPLLQFMELNNLKFYGLKEIVFFDLK
jgi:hypothetical protein